MCAGAGARYALAAPEAEKRTPGDEDEFERILIEGDDVPVTDPQDAPAVEKQSNLWHIDGTAVVDRRCRIERDKASGWSLVTFEAEPGAASPRPRWALPNELLEKVESLIEENPDRTYRVSGETTIYREQVFLLLRKVIIEARGAGAVAPKPAVKSTPALAAKTEPPADAESATPAAPPENQQTTKPAKSAKKPPSSKDILDSLLDDRPGKPVIAPIVRPDEQPKAAPSVAPGATGEVLPAARGKMVADRTVRLLLAGVGVWKEARFEADNTLREPPIRMLPCHMLERAERFGSAGTVKLRITGEITHYRGRRYLLLRKLLRVRDLGQF